MKETVLSNNERSFVEKAILSSVRIDKRSLDQFREVSIDFGLVWGSVCVALGNTKVLAQVSCDIATPKTSRPNEGTLFVNVELGPLAAPHFESGFQQSDAFIQTNRILERTLRDSKCVDLESLCIIAEEKVWNLRIDINVLNHEGNIIDCASIAAIAALAHFKRPDVTASNNEFKVHTPAEKDLIPIVLHHYPICISYVLFNEGKIAVADPSALEERVSDANLVFAINSYKELCCMHLGGTISTSPQLIMRYSSKAAERARRIVEFVKSSLLDDEKNRSNGDHVGFSECIRTNKITARKLEAQNLEDFEEPSMELNETDRESTREEPGEIIKLDDNTVVSKKALENFSCEEENSSEDSDVEMVPEENFLKKMNKVSKPIVIDDGDSEEDETIILH